MVTMGVFPFQGKTDMVEPGIEPGTSWLIVRSSDHQATRLVRRKKKKCIYYYFASCHRLFLPGTSPLESTAIPTALGSSFGYTWNIARITCDVPSIADFAVNLLNVFLVLLPNFSLNLFLLFWWLQVLPI